MSMNLLNKYAIPQVQIPNTPEEDDNVGKTVWKNGRLVEFDEGGDYVNVYIAHTDEETIDEAGEIKKITRAFEIRVKKPVEVEKIISAAQQEIYKIAHVEDLVNLNAEIMRKFVNSQSDETVKEHYRLIRWINDEINLAYGITVDTAKDIMINRINEYDTSTEVNAFYLNGIITWLDKETRVGLMNSISIEQAAGRTQSTLWFGTTSITVDCNTAIQFLSALELYALECYNKTAEHKSIISGMNDVNEIMKYDYTVGYPEKLSITV